MLPNKFLNMIQDCVDELYHTLLCTHVDNVTDHTMGECVTLCTRYKIYNNSTQLIRIYRKTKTVDKSLLNRIHKQLKLHRYQINKLHKKENRISPTALQTNHRYLIGLAALLHSAFTTHL